MLQREIAQLKSKQTELSKIKKSLDDAVKSQKEEIKKMKGNQQYLRKQFEHDVRKSEREMVKLKEKLVQVMHFLPLHLSILIIAIALTFEFWFCIPNYDVKFCEDYPYR